MPSAQINLTKEQSLGLKMHFLDSNNVPWIEGNSATIKLVGSPLGLDSSNTANIDVNSSGNNNLLIPGILGKQQTTSP
jgi:hypothetical protein